MPSLQQQLSQALKTQHQLLSLNSQQSWWWRLPLRPMAAAHPLRQQLPACQQRQLTSRLALQSRAWCRSQQQARRRPRRQRLCWQLRRRAAMPWPRQRMPSHQQPLQQPAALMRSRAPLLMRQQTRRSKPVRWLQLQPMTAAWQPRRARSWRTRRMNRCPCQSRRHLQSSCHPRLRLSPRQVSCPCLLGQGICQSRLPPCTRPAPGFQGARSSHARAMAAAGSRT
jgi:hypothetical protein